MKSDFAIVIRYAGESTVEFLKSQISNWFPDTPMEVVSSDSFEQTLKMSYEAALRHGKKWALMIDADILFSNTLRRMLPRAIANTEEEAFGFSFLIWDRFYDKPKYRGLHVYQTKYIAQAMKFIPSSGSALRPETHVKQTMAKEGYPWVKYGNVIGLHDFFQQPQDIFAKMAIRAHRSAMDLQELKECFQQRESEFDFKVAYEGISYGETLSRAEVRNTRSDYAQAFAETGLLKDKFIMPTLTQRQINLYILRLLMSKVSWKFALKNRLSLILKL